MNKLLTITTAALVAGCVHPIYALAGEPEKQATSSQQSARYTPEQIDRVKSIKSRFAKESGPKRLELKSLKHKLQEALSSPEVDRSNAMQLQSKINSLTGEIAQQRLDMQLSLLALLTPDERKEIRSRAIKQQFHKKPARTAKTVMTR